MEKLVVGLAEKVIVHSDNTNVEADARIDTGATKSSIDLKLASQLKLGPVITSKYVRSAHESKLRPVVEVELTIRGKRIKTLFTLADRSHMKYKVLIGQMVLKDGFLIDPSLK